MSTHPTTPAIDLPPLAKKIMQTLNKHSYECFLVGGFIRDALLNRTHSTSEIDFATNAHPEDIQRVFEKTVYDNPFGTVIAVVDDTPVEITTYRSESVYSDSRHPDSVSWGKTIHEDVKRRDFTINACAFDGKHFIDDWGGVRDVEKKLIRTVGKAQERFQEDALRMLRAVRFAAQLGFAIEDETMKAIVDKHELLEKISGERIRDEFLKILGSNHPAQGVLLLRNTKLLDTFLPELATSFSCEQKSPGRHHIYDAGTHMVQSLAALENPDPIVRMATLLHDIGKPATRKVNEKGITTFYNHEIIGTDIAYSIAKRLRLSKKDSTLLTKLVRYHQFTVDERQTDAAIRRTIRNVGPENITALIDVRFADRIGSGAKPDSWRFQKFRERVIEVQKKPFSIPDLAIDGRDVMKEKNISPGPEVGRYLQELFDAVTQQGIENTRESLISALKDLHTHR